MTSSWNQLHVLFQNFLTVYYRFVPLTQGLTFSQANKKGDKECTKSGVGVQREHFDEA